MGRSPRPPDPDPRMGEAALAQAQLAQEMASMSRDQMADQRAQDAKNYGLAQEQYQYQKGIMDQQMGWAAEDRQRMNDVYRPLEDRVINDANNWDSADNMSRRVGQAQADVQQAIAQQNAAQSQRMLNMGINPNSGRFAGAMRSQAFDNAALQAGIKNQTRGQLLAEGAALRGQAAAMGNPLLGASYGGLDAAGGSAQGLTNPFLAANQNSIAGWQVGMGGMDQSGGALGRSFDMYNSMHKNALDIWQTKAQNRAGMIGAGAGLVGLAAGGPLGSAAADWLTDH